MKANKIMLKRNHIQPATEMQNCLHYKEIIIIVPQVIGNRTGVRIVSKKL